MVKGTSWHDQRRQTEAVLLNYKKIVTNIYTGFFSTSFIFHISRSTLLSRQMGSTSNHQKNSIYNTVENSPAIKQINKAQK